jgi:Transglycosylase SLT domain
MSNSVPQFLHGIVVAELIPDGGRMIRLKSIAILAALLPAIAPVTSAQKKQEDRIVRMIERSEPKHIRSRQNFDKILRGQPHFWLELQAVAARLKTQPEWLLNVMAVESLLNPSARNSLPGQTASGLLQFIEATAQSMGTTTAAIRRMSPVEQLRLIEKYLTPFRGRLHSQADIYTAVFRGFIVAGGDASVVAPLDSSKKEQRIYSLNRWLDFNSDGKITKGELALAAYTIGRFFPSKPLAGSSQYLNSLYATDQKVVTHQTRSIFVRSQNSQ